MGRSGPAYMDLGVACPVGLFAFKIHMENPGSAPKRQLKILGLPQNPTTFLDHPPSNENPRSAQVGNHFLPKYRLFDGLWSIVTFSLSPSGFLKWKPWLGNPGNSIPNKQTCSCFELIILSHHCGTYFVLATGVQSLLVSLHFMQLLFITYLFSFPFNGKTYLFTTQCWRTRNIDFFDFNQLFSP